MSRSALFAGLRRAAAIATLARQPAAPPIDELATMPLGRRGLLAGLGAGALLAGLPRAVTAQPRHAARIAVIGAGLAGLVAAHRLVEAGADDVTLYEASRRSGGRILTGHDAVGPGTLPELGGSFINGDHADMLALAREFALPLEDGFEDPTEILYFIDGQPRSIAEVAAAAAPFLALLATLKAQSREAQDALSAAEVMDRFGLSGWLRRLLDIGLTQEMGCPPEAMSALYLIEYFAPDPAEAKRGLFSSDQRYQIAGGNDRLPAALAARLDGRIETGQRLLGIRRGGDGYVLGFPGRDVAADIVVLTLPATTLRQVVLGVPLLPLTLQAIRELGYGSGAKLIAGLDRRPWRAQGLSGETINDLGHQSCWEDHAAPGTGPGSLTIFAGGAVGADFARGATGERVRQAVAGLDAALPGVRAAYNGNHARMTWPQNPYALGSYACFAPGQYDGFSEAWAPSGRIVFAGEHTSEEHSGYMNGAAESGRLAAERVLGWLRG